MGDTISATADHMLGRERSQPAYQAYQILHIGFTVAPIVAGADKFLHLLVNWDQYLSPWIAARSPISGHHLMLAAGVVEIVAGALVAIQPKIFAPVVGIWLCLIFINLVSMGAYLDVAVCDIGLVLGAFALGRLAIGVEQNRRIQ